MKIAITGHTSGLGKGLFDHFSIDHEVIGFSKTNKYDITRFYEVIVNKSLDCDVFINNACVHNYQNLMFDLLLNHWKSNGNKTIVNINSIAKFDGNMNTYALEKQRLADKSMAASRDDENVKCRIINCTVGPIAYGWKKDITHILTTEECVNIISFAVKLPQHIELAELSFWSLDNKVNKYIQK